MSYDRYFIDLQLPEALDKEEIIECFCKMKNGDIEARQKLIVHNIRLVINIAIKFCTCTKYEMNELVSVGIIGLIKSVDTFNLEKSDKFVAYASVCISNEILMLLRKEKHYTSLKHIEDYITLNDDDDSLTIGETLYDEDYDLTEEYETKESYKIVRKVVDSLQEPYKEIIKMYFGFYNNKVYNQVEIARKFNLSQSCICKTIQRILRIINKELIKEGIVEKNITKKYTKTN